MLISSIKERDEVSLSQKTIALKGFVLSIQLVMIEASLSLNRVVQAGCSSGSEGDCQDDDDFVDGDSEGKKSINPSHVREIDSSGKAHVVSIVSDGVDLNNVDAEIAWSDSEDDVLVDNLAKCIQEGIRSDVIRMREEAVKENNVRKTSKGIVRQHRADGLDADYVASTVKQSVSLDLRRMEEEIKNLGQTVSESQNLMRSYLQDMFDTFHRDIVSLKPQCTRTHADTPNATEAETTDTRKNTTTGSNPADTRNIIQEALVRPSNCCYILLTRTTFYRPRSFVWRRSQPNSDKNDLGGGDDPVRKCLPYPCTEGVSSIACSEFQPFPNPLVDKNTPPPELKENVQTNLAFSKPTFSLGLSQEETHVSKTDSLVVENVDESLEDVIPIPLADNQDQFPAHRKSKRQKVVPRALLGDYQCDKRFLTRAWEVHVNATHSCPNIDYAGKFGLLSEKLQADLCLCYVIKVGGHTLDSRELSAFIARSSHFPQRLKAELSEVKDDVVALEKKLEHRKVMTDMMRKAWCAIL
ncbi:hypothetical protein Bca52824_035143 [Brassica carinata]|uniref:Uncharacterized protein n=1 Tax=Brassica carinata TaxID=52824 RepID=A0A8X7V3U3_BRACI|nr:hypothetical protein Bca52824_035143 [Brassica carinata]